MRNRLGDNFAKNLQKAICFDKYLKVINISGNQISEYGMKTIVKLALMENSSLIGFDARLNPGCTEKIERQLALCMLKNIEKQQSKGLEINPKYLHPELYSFGIPMAITKGLGLRHVNEKKKRKSRSPAAKHPSSQSIPLNASHGQSAISSGAYEAYNSGQINLENLG